MTSRHRLVLVIRKKVFNKYFNTTVSRGSEERRQGRAREHRTNLQIWKTGPKLGQWKSQPNDELINECTFLKIVLRSTWCVTEDPFRRGTLGQQTYDSWPYTETCFYREGLGLRHCSFFLLNREQWWLRPEAALKSGHSGEEGGE